MEIPKNEFSFTEMKNQYENGMLKEHLDCKNYIGKYFYPTTSGTHVLFEDGKPTVIQDETMKKVYLGRFDKQISKWYLKETIPKKLICDITKPTLTEHQVNLCPRIKHDYQKYETFSNDIKAKVKIFLDYVKLIWASNNEEVYQYILKWLSNVVKGVKNKTCLYAKGIEGVGKTTLADILSKHVIGLDLFVKGKADHLKGQHNMQLLGKILVVFEELQYFTDKEWLAIDSEIKDMITSDYMSYVDKYEKRFDAQNVNNYIICTNYNAVKGANGRRYLVCDINPEKQNDFAYFKNILDNCLNDDTGRAIYCYLCEIYTKDFNSLNMPETKAKLELCVDLLAPIEKFLKRYVLNNKGINEKVKDLHAKYASFCTVHKFYDASIQKFSQSMRELTFQYKKLNGYNTYKISLDQLKEIAQKRKWIHELDEPTQEDADDEAHDKGVDKTDRSIPMVLKSEYDKLKAELCALKKEHSNSKYPTKIKIVYRTEPSTYMKGLKIIRELDKYYQPERVGDIVSNGKSKGVNTNIETKTNILYDKHTDSQIQKFFD